MIRVAVLAVLLAGCPGDDAPMMPADAGPDAFPIGGEFWPCFGWQVTDYPDVELCAPGCSNYGTVGKHSESDDESCEIADGVFCQGKYVNGQPWDPGVSCCLYVASPERVERISCR